MLFLFGESTGDEVTENTLREEVSKLLFPVLRLLSLDTVLSFSFCRKRREILKEDVTIETSYGSTLKQKPGVELFSKLFVTDTVKKKRGDSFSMSNL